MARRSYKQLTERDRLLIADLQKRNLSLSEIARRIGKDKSTISREFKRNAMPALTTFDPGSLTSIDPGVTRRDDVERNAIIGSFPAPVRGIRTASSHRRRLA